MIRNADVVVAGLFQVHLSACAMQDTTTQAPKPAGISEMEPLWTSRTCTGMFSYFDDAEFLLECSTEK